MSLLKQSKDLVVFLFLSAIFSFLFLKMEILLLTMCIGVVMWGLALFWCYKYFCHQVTSWAFLICLFLLIIGYIYMGFFYNYRCTSIFLAFSILCSIVLINCILFLHLGLLHCFTNAWIQLKRVLQRRLPWHLMQ